MNRKDTAKFNKGNLVTCDGYYGWNKDIYGDVGVVIDRKFVQGCWFYRVFARMRIFGYFNECILEEAHE